MAPRLNAEESWQPVRTVTHGQRCDFCWRHIAPAKPGNTTGSRGTKAWFSRTRRVWECLACRSEAVRADLAREASCASR